MPKQRNPDSYKAEELYKQGLSLVEIASQLNQPEGTVRRWKHTYKWDTERSDKNSERSEKKRGSQPGNKNAVGHGAPKGNQNAEKFGFFSKHLPEETLAIIQEMPTDPLDVLWDQIQIAYAAIIRAQKIMYVTDQDDSTTTKIEEKSGESSWGEKWEVQQAWDKHGSFLQAQARAQKTLESMIAKYEELLHKNWDLATDEQKARIEQLKANTERLRKDSSPEDDGGGVEIINDAPQKAGTDIGYCNPEVSSDIQ